MVAFTAGTLQFKAKQDGSKWSFVAEKIRNEDDVEMAHLALSDALPKLGFELEHDLQANGSSTIVVPVIAPVYRYWNGANLESGEILGPDARLELRTAKQPAVVGWAQEGLAEQRVVVGQDAQPIVHDGGVIALRSSVPTVAAAFDTLSWNDEHAELAAEGALRFENLPGFTPGTEGNVAIDGDAAEFLVAYDADAQRFRTTIRLGDERPRAMRLRFTWNARWNGDALTSESELVMPVAFEDAEFSTTDGTFGACIFLGLPPEIVRFAKHSYLPDEIALRFQFRTHQWLCNARHQPDTACPAAYKIEWEGEEVFKTFRRAAPGRIVMSVVGETRQSREIALLPGLVRGTWTNRDDRAQFRLAPAGIDEREIRSFIAAESNVAIDVTVTNDGYVVPAQNALRCASHIVFKDGATVPLDPGAFKPLYLDDPAALWGRSKRTALVGAEPNAPDVAVTLLRGSAALIRGDGASLASIPRALLQELAAAPAILQFGDAQYQLLVYRGTTPKFGARLDTSGVAAAKTAGLYFRGFYFVVRLISADGPLAPGGKMLLLDTPLSLSFAAMSNHFLAFSPLRAVVDSKRGFVRLLAGGHRIDLSLNDGIITRAEPAAFARLGYLYGSRDNAMWSPVPSKAAPWLYTFDNLAFAATDDSIAFAGWFLPNGAAVFPAQAPFPAYGFDFSNSGSVASAVLDPLPLRIGRWETELDVDESRLEEFEAKVEERLKEISVPPSSHQQISQHSFTVDTDDGRQYELTVQLDQATPLLRLIVAPPSSSPAVRFFSLT